MGVPSHAYSCLLSGLLLGSALPSQGADVACPSSTWLSFGRSCYALLQGVLKAHSIDDFREFCRDNASGADIISINNKEENAFIRSSFCTHWHGPEYISLGMFFDIDDNVFKWYDQSKVNFTNWVEEESNEELINTCAIMHTASGGWKKASCEHLPLTEILCETTILYEKKYLADNTAWTTTLIITSTIIVSVSAAFIWLLYQRRVSSGTRCTAYNSITPVPSSDEAILIEEENEYTA
ncbi:CD302 antigen [Rhineura floridana]|uniref:CD302 antigen n=1 Tax=Rhineura floridana TaxID=261503 RepID=UPI002AC7F4E5|nr:CD302 antigen [Rhineura floridana]